MVMAENQNPVGAIIQQLADAKDLSLKELSEGLGRNHAYLQQFITKGSPKVLPENVRLGLAAKLGVDPDNLLPQNYKEARKLIATYRGDTHSTPARQKADGSVTIAGEAFLTVPVYDIRASAGAGALVEDGPPTTHQVFRENFLRRLTRTSLDNLSVIQVSGDSMWETLHDGDAVLVDRSVTRIVKDGIYILQLEGELLVKRCARDLEDGSVLVISDNPKYPQQRVKKADRLSVLGRVIWMGRAVG